MSVKNQNGFVAKILLPVVALLIVVGFIYWSTGDGNRTADNPVAKGVAKFYAEVRQAVKPGASRLDDYTIELPPSESSVSDQLQQRAEIVRPANKNWAGETKKRSFKENDTIKSALQDFARAEGAELIWDLKYDYIIKNHFSDRSNLKSLVHKITNTVAGDFGGSVHSYFCPKERTMVVTDNPTDYLTTSCVTTMSAAKEQKLRRMEREYQQEREDGGY
jgi:hypothetical protein